MIKSYNVINIRRYGRIANETTIRKSSYEMDIINYRQPDGLQQ